jgi:hypothetical protein
MVLSDNGVQSGFLKSWSLRCMRGWLAAQNVHDYEHDNHQDGDPNRDFPEGTDACHAPVQGETLGTGEIRVAVFASLSLERADATAFRAGLRIEPLRH